VTDTPSPLRPTITLWVLLAAFGFLLASLVVGALRRPVPAAADVTAPDPASVGDTLVGPAAYTVDATDELRWTFFDFSRNAVVQVPGPLDWDLAFRRFEIIANGGTGFAGQGGVVDLGVVPFDSVREVPATGYLGTERDSTNPGIGHWYKYGYSSHLLDPGGHTYAVRTADGHYAKFSIVGYYCGEVRSGCFTIRYAYQGNGSRRLQSSPEGLARPNSAR
jgi:heme-binding HmuY-like protein